MFCNRLNLKFHFKLLLLIPVLLCLTSCFEEVYVGDYEDFPVNNISPQKAEELARPYLDRSYKIRVEKRGETISDEDARKDVPIWLTLKGKYYYVAKDHYPSYSPGFYLYSAVKVNKDTGEVIEPR